MLTLSPDRQWQLHLTVFFLPRLLCPQQPRGRGSPAGVQVRGHGVLPSLWSGIILYDVNIYITD